MNPNVGRRAGKNIPPPEKPKTKSRLYIESKIQRNLSMKEDYVRLKHVAVAINMNALEQRMITKQQILKMIESDLPKKVIIEKLEKEIHLDRHR